MWGEDDASDQGYDWMKAISKAAEIVPDSMILQSVMRRHSREH